MKIFNILLVLLVVLIAVSAVSVAETNKMFVEFGLTPISYAGDMGKYFTSYSGNVVNIDFGINAEYGVFTIGTQFVSQTVDQYCSTLLATLAIVDEVPFYTGFMNGASLTIKVKIYLN